MLRSPPSSSLFFFNDTATTEIYTLSLHDALPIYRVRQGPHGADEKFHDGSVKLRQRSEEHTSELQSPCNLVCRLLLEKKKKTTCVFWCCRTSPTTASEDKRGLAADSRLAPPRIAP